MLKVLFFGKLVEISGAQEIAFPVNENIAQLLAQLKTQFPKLNERTFTVALNHNVCKNYETHLKTGDVIALLPPFSGG